MIGSWMMFSNVQIPHSYFMMFFSFTNDNNMIYGQIFIDAKKKLKVYQHDKNLIIVAIKIEVAYL